MAAGDIYCIRGKTEFWAWAVRHFNRDAKPSFCNHVAIEGHGELLEHRPSGLGHAALDKYADPDYYAVRVYRPVGFAPCAVQRLVIAAYKYIGYRYCWVSIGCQGLDWASDSRFFTERFAPEKRLVCSSFLALICTMELGIAWVDVDKGNKPLAIRSVRPDDIDDQLRTDPRLPLVSETG